MSVKNLWFSILAIPLVWYLSCGDDEPEKKKEENQPPRITMIGSARDTIAPSDTTLLFAGVDEDDEGDPTYMVWRILDKGRFITSAIQDKIVWEAPAEVGVYRMQFNATDLKDTVADTISVTVAIQPKLAVDPQALDFGLTDLQLPLLLKNVALSGEITFKITADQPWITISQDTGIVSTELTIQVTIDRTTLRTKGIHRGNLQINTNINNIKVPVSATADPILVASDTLIDFGLIDSVRFLSLWSSTGGGVEWYIPSYAPKWYTIYPIEGIVAEDTTKVRIAISRSNYTAGNYSETIYFNYGKDFRAVKVTLKMAIVPGAAFNLDTLNFGKAAINLPLILANTGTGTMNWELHTDVDWCYFEPYQGELKQKKSQEIIVSVNRMNKAIGKYQGILYTENEGNVDTCIIMMEIAPILTLNPGFLDFGDTTKQLFTIITNTGYGDLNWNVSSTNTWLSFSKTEGIAPTNGTDTLYVRADRMGLRLNTDTTGAIRIRGPGADTTINARVKASIQPGHYSGTTSKNYSVEFDLSYSPLQVINARFKLTGCDQTLDVQNFTGGEVNNDRFTLVSTYATVTGRFTGPKKATGTYEMQIGDCTANGTWNAEAQ